MANGPAVKINPVLVGFDFDGVIADIGEAFIRLACTRYNDCDVELEQLSSFQVDQCLDLPLPIIERIFDDILEDSIATELKPFSGAVESLQRLSSHGRVTIITARPALEPVREWLKLHLGDQSDGAVRLVSSGNHNDKERYIRQNNIRYFIDDRAATCMQLAEAGLKPLVFSQPWNRNQHNLPTVSSWREIIELLDVPEV